MLTVAGVCVFLLTFAAAGAAVWGAGRFMHGRTNGAEERGNGESAVTEEFDWLTPVDVPTLLKEETLSTISIWDRVLTRINGVEVMKQRLAESGMRWSVGRLTAMMLLAGTATMVFLWPMSWAPGYAVLICGLIAGSGPYWVVLRRRRRRLAKLEEQFPEALDSLARSLRAGNALAAACEILCRELPQPLNREFRKALDERNLGTNWEQALANLARRIPLVEVSIFAAAIQLQSRTGGRLHEVLAKVAETMRESAALKGEVRSIAAHGRMTGMILTALPLLIVVIMAYVNPSQIYVLWTHPTGHHLVWISVACLAAAHVIIRKMVDIRI